MGHIHGTHESGATVDCEERSGDVSGRVRAQICRQLSDLYRIAQAAHKGDLAEFAKLFLHLVGGHVRHKVSVQAGFEGSRTVEVD